MKFEEQVNELLRLYDDALERANKTVPSDPYYAGYADGIKRALRLVGGLTSVPCLEIVLFGAILD